MQDHGFKLLIMIYVKAEIIFHHFLFGLSSLYYQLNQLNVNVSQI